jgi:hypothetical protein
VAIAFSNQHVVKGVIPAGPPLTCLAALHGYLLRAGWASVPYSNGHHYVFTSPQGLSSGCRIWYPADSDYPNCMALQMVSQTDGDEGLVHHFLAGYDAQYPGDPLAFSQYRIWANCCSLFLAAPGVEMSGYWPSSVSCGVPFAYGAVEPTVACSALNPSAGVTGEIWWSGGDDGGRPLVFGERWDLPAFRSAYYCTRYSWGYNGAIRSIDGRGLPVTGLLQFLTLKPALFYPNAFSNGLRCEDLSPLIHDPLLVESGTIYGQLYDVCLESMPTPLEHVEQISDTVNGTLTNWINYSKQNLGFGASPGVDDSEFYSLLLFTGDATSGPPDNLAY